MSTAHHAFRSIMAALFCAAFGYLFSPIHAVPKLIVKQLSGAGLYTLTVSGTGLPEVQSITVQCSYSVSRSVIVDALASTPLPASAISVRIDSTTSVVLVTIAAAKAVSIKDDATILLLKMASPEGGSAPISAKKATLVDKGGTSTEVPIDVASSCIPVTLNNIYTIESAAPFKENQTYQLDGRVNTGLRHSSGCLIISRSSLRMNKLIDVR